MCATNRRGASIFMCDHCKSFVFLITSRSMGEATYAFDQCEHDNKSHTYVSMYIQWIGLHLIPVMSHPMEEGGAGCQFSATTGRRLVSCHL
jgi:hypothetical protein